MRVLVTGAAGFVGSRLSKTLLARGDEVIGLDNLDAYYPIEHKQRHLADLLPEKRFRSVTGDLRDAPMLKKLLADHRPDAVAHLAGMAAVRYSVAHPLVYGEVNVQGSMNLLDAAAPPRPAADGAEGVHPARFMAGTRPCRLRKMPPATLPLAPYPAE